MANRRKSCRRRPLFDCQYEFCLTYLTVKLPVRIVFSSYGFVEEFLRKLDNLKSSLQAPSTSASPDSNIFIDVERWSWERGAKEIDLLEGQSGMNGRRAIDRRGRRVAINQDLQGQKFSLNYFRPLLRWQPGRLA